MSVAASTDHSGSRLWGVAYSITNLSNSKIYIGVTRRSPTRRWAAHLRTARNSDSDRPLYRAMARHGSHNFLFEVLASATSHENLRELECTLVAQRGSFWESGTGYNLTLGGDGQLGRKQSAATRQKMSKTRKGRRHSPRHAAAIGAALMGRKLSPEHRIKVGAARRGKSLTAEHVEAIRSANTGRKMSRQSIDKTRMSKGHVWPKDKEARFIDLVQRGTYYKEIGQEFGITKSGVYTRIKMFGLNPRRSGLHQPELPL